VRAAGIDLLVVDSQGAVGSFIPLWLQAGLNTLWLGDVAAAGLDYCRLRQCYGQDLRLVGGIDLRVLSRDASAVEREVMRLVPPLLEQGGYIPLLDGRVRKGVPFANYACYRELLRRLAEDV
jgi:uroporphyrinogen decarboxylase